MSTDTQPSVGDIIQEDGKFFQIGDSGTKVPITEDQAKQRGYRGPTGVQLTKEQPNPADLHTDEDQTPGAQAIREAAKSPQAAKDLDAIERVDAVAWFMEDDPDEAPAQRKLELDVSLDPTKPKIIEWVIQAIQREEIQSIREKSKTKAGRRGRTTEGPSENVSLANTKIAAAGTLYPNLRDAQVRGDFLDPADALKYRFRNKPGLIDQIAGHVIEVSGYDEADVREVAAVGN